MPRFRRQFPTLLLVVVSVFALTGFGCREKPIISGGTNLIVWGLWQDSNSMTPVLKTFEEQTGIKVTYKRISSVSSYEQELLTALAENRGPDVFVIHHTWVDEKMSLISPAPVEIINSRQVQDEFVDVVAADVVRSGQVYALPTSVDTLAMFFNKDLLNANSVARPPRTWNDFQQMVERVTRVDRLGSLQQSAASLGTAANVNRASDIIQLLLLQSGLPIYNQSQNQIQINNEIGQRAFTFYTDYSNKAKRVYTWNLQQDYSIDAFAEGETATMFNYSYHVPTIRAKNPRLNFAVAPMPQIADTADTRRVNFAAYWPFVVSNRSQNKTQAWQFIRYITGPNASPAINSAMEAPPARRDSVVQSQHDPVIGVFAEQSLSATTWRRQAGTAVDSIFNTAIDNIASGSATVNDALRRAEDQLNKLYE
jgi:multiple sugar transport system substrate-binding protein